MPGMLKGNDTSSLSHSPSLSVSTQSVSSLSHVSHHQYHQSPISSASAHQLTWLQELRSEERGLYLIQLLLSCANAVAVNNMEYTNIYLEQLAVLASLTGDPMQRVATYFMEGLADRITKSWPGVYKALHSTHLPSVMDILSARQVFFSVCPYLKFAFLLVNQAILDAMEGEKVVHIIDLEASDPVQWLALLQAMRFRPGGPPHLRITGVSKKRDVLEQTGQRLSEEAEKLDIPFQFNPVVANLENLDIELLKVKSGEAVGISSVMTLHKLLAKETPHAPNNLCRSCSGNGRSCGAGRVDDSRNEGNSSAAATATDRGVKRTRQTFETDGRTSLATSPEGANLDEIDSNVDREEPPVESCPRVVDRVLRDLQSLSPKVMVVIEQESSHNGSQMLERFVEALHYYCAMFDSLDSTLPQHCLERVTLEKYLLGQEIKNIVACEGVERVERHEKLEIWSQRIITAGFAGLPLSISAVEQARRLLQSYPCDSYRLLEQRGCLTLCWQDTPLFTASAWTAK